MYAASEAGQPDRGVEIVTRMSHQMIYLGHPGNALGLLGVAAKRARLPAVKALVASQTGRGGSTPPSATSKVRSSTSAPRTSWSPTA
ncbi:hypothetical protein [Streptomyces achromogenes]|uniref:hypothetical protein n=1 Tax=Streptomyces achromogenes TaxID=67255 RepID=UPI00340826A9